jgi:hypothetical protein
MKYVIPQQRSAPNPSEFPSTPEKEPLAEGEFEQIQTFSILTSDN